MLDQEALSVVSREPGKGQRVMAGKKGDDRENDAAAGRARVLLEAELAAMARRLKAAQDRAHRREMLLGHEMLRQQAEALTAAQAAADRVAALQAEITTGAEQLARAGAAEATAQARARNAEAAAAETRAELGRTRAALDQSQAARTRAETALAGLRASVWGRLARLTGRDPGS